MAHYLSLNRADFLFVPAQEQFGISEPHAIQVMIYSTGFRSSPQIESSVEDIAFYFHAQPEITAPSSNSQVAVENIMIAHLSQACTFPKRVIIEGATYILHGERLPCELVKELVLKHGEENVKIADDKWIFEFIPKRGMKKL
ncbi:hypothetical protein K435DRAFT_856435 [Dendrothele bispora CBS 962.96]|uniref:Uncharacterized protein n=1 Tax=Dendrothele bispora (strain CBS 962.96) TaxID=1314807 RepID=A0A4S8M994_DENBC|nr:hypothetical protein K435DRAFT_856435 [Dendrothele bispora CBS 962.96]